MRKRTFKALLMIGIVSSSLNVLADEPITETDKKVIEMTNDNDNGINEETLSVPVTATVNNSLLNVKFNGSVSLATVSVSNTLTGATINSQSLPAVSGTICKVPVSGLSTGVYTVSVTNEENGESVSGEFDVEE